MKLYTCILFCKDGSVKKYRNINNINRFELFAKKINGKYFNVYDKTTKQFINQLKVNNDL
jgi:hypothetical protein